MVTQKLGHGDLVEVIEEQFAVPAGTRGTYSYAFAAWEFPRYVEIEVNNELKIIVTEDNIREAGPLPDGLWMLSDVKLVTNLRYPFTTEHFRETQKKHRERAKAQENAVARQGFKEHMERLEAESRARRLPSGPGPRTSFGRGAEAQRMIDEYNHRQMHRGAPGPTESES